MVVRTLELKDIPQLSILYRQFWNETSNIEKMEQKFTQLQQREDYIFLCAEIENRLCGSIMGIVCEELYGECMPFLVVENMVVDMHMRRSGIGKVLFSEMERRAKGMGCTQILLVTESNRTDACHFYESLGFSPMANKGYKKKL